MSFSLLNSEHFQKLFFVFDIFEDYNLLSFFFKRVFLIWHLYDINLCLDSRYVFLLRILHRQYYGLFRVSHLKMSIYSLVILIMLTQSMYCLISPLPNYYFLLTTNKQSMERHFKTLQIMCFSSKFLRRYIIHR